MSKQKNTGNGIAKEVELPSGITASLHNNILSVKGPKGEVKRELKQKGIDVKVEDHKILITSGRITRREKKAAGSLEAHFKNMIRGAANPHAYTLKICSGHFPMNVSITGNKFVVKNFLGEKVPRTLVLKHGAEVKIEGELIKITSPSKELAGQVSADIEQLTRRPGFDTRVFQDGIYIINKDGKDLK